MWVPTEHKDPLLLNAPTRKPVACFGAVSLHSGKFVLAMSARFNAARFEAFPIQLLRHRSGDRKLVVIPDNARYHHARLLAPLLHRYRRQLSLLFLQPYCPQLAPIEHVWK